MTESYKLTELQDTEWVTRPEYVDCQGVGVDHIMSLHADKGTPFGAHWFGDDGKFKDHLAIIHTTNQFQCEAWLYQVNSWAADGDPKKLDPSFMAFIKTYEGVHEVLPSAATFPLPGAAVDQMKWLLALCEERGWRLD